jgi:hypothetical protein
VVWVYIAKSENLGRLICSNAWLVHSPRRKHNDGFDFRILSIKITAVAERPRKIKTFSKFALRPEFFKKRFFYAGTKGILMFDIGQSY